MVKPNPANPPKRQVRRLRTGCKTCKKRKIQCDETKPECAACLKNGRSCPGYEREFKWSRKHEVSTDLSQKHESSINMIDSVEWNNTQTVEEPCSAVAEAEPLIPSNDRRSTRPQSTPPTQQLEHDFALEFAQSQTLDQWNMAPGCEMGFSDLLWLPDVDSLVRPDFVEIQPEEREQLLPSSTNNHHLLDSVMSQNSISASLIPDSTQCSPREDTPPMNRQGEQHIPSSLTDIPSTLIEHWFKNICPMWSSFDSAQNLNRSLALNTWTDSKAVFYCLQAMSAIHLAEQLPHLNRTATSCWNTAVKAIQQDLAQFTMDRVHRELPKGLLLSITGIGTASCWADSQQLGIPLLKKMKTILSYFNQFGAHLSASDYMYLTFFNDSCLYWEIMCRVVVANDSPIGPSLRKPPRPSLNDTPHPWSGVSMHVLRLFGDVIALCREYCLHIRMLDVHNATSNSLRDLLSHINKARELRRTLINLDRPILAGLMGTGDDLTPLTHLCDVAEGYRQSALLHLYLTFQDLGEEFRQETAGMNNDDADTWSQRLGLDLLYLLQRIPPNSGSRCIQPLLYLSVATSLKTPPTIPLMDEKNALFVSSPINPIIPPTTVDPSPYSRSESMSNTQITPITVEIAQARRVVMQRLSMLEFSLPSKPISVLIELIQKVWGALDDESFCQKSHGRRRHWIEIMEESSLWTIFG